MLALATGLAAIAQLVVNKGNLNIGSSSNMYVAGSLENAAGGAPTINGTLQLTGNFTNNGGNLSGTGTTIFSGTVTQTIAGSTSTTFHNVTKPNSNTLVLGNNETINGLFALTAGNVLLNDKVLTMNGTLSGAGVFTGSANSGIVIGTASSSTLGTLLFDQSNDTVTNTLKTLSITNGGRAALGNTLNITPGSPGGYGTVTVTGPTGFLDANAFLVLRSNSQGDARVAQSTGSIIDTVMVERYIPRRRAWRFLTVPFSSTSQNINQAWMEGSEPNPTIYDRNNPKPGYGVQITYWQNSQSSGFDQNTTSNPSIRTWDPALRGWGAGVTNTYLNKLTDFPAYYIFIRGDRSIDLSLATAAPPTATTLRARGILNETGGNIIKTFPSLTAGQLFMAGNPLASATQILPMLARSTNVVPAKFWVWDPNNVALQYPYNVGYYVSYSNGTVVPNDGKYKGGTDLQIGQGLLLEVAPSGGAPQLTFAQADKVNTQAIVFGMQPMRRPDPTAPSVVYTNLLSAGMGMGTVDGVGAAFGKRYSAAIDQYDATKMWNLNESMAMVRDNQFLAIEFRPTPQVSDTLFYRMYLYVQPYTLQIFSNNLPADLPGEAWLVDKYLNTETPVNLYDTTLYSFTPTADTNTYLNRFMLVFNRLPRNKSIATTPGRNTEADAKGSVRFYPNPVTANEANLRFANMPKGNYDIIIYSNTGEKLATKTVEHTGASMSHTLPINASWPSGFYNAFIVNKATQKTMSLQLIINR